MDRRTFIASSAALGLTTTPSAAAPIDPIVPMFARWEAAIGEWQHLSRAGTDLDAPEMLALEATRFAILDEITAHQAQSLEGLHCQLIMYWEEYGPEFVKGSKGSDEERQEPSFTLLARVLVGWATYTHAPQWQSPNSKKVSPVSF